MNLRLRRIKHVRKHFPGHIKSNGDYGDKGDQHPTHRAGAKDVIGHVHVRRKVTGSDAADQLVRANSKKVKANGQKDDTVPRIGQATVKAFSHTFAEREGWPTSVDQRLVFKEYLFDWSNNKGQNHELGPPSK
jgi:hypothetical protein